MSNTALAQAVEPFSNRTNARQCVEGQRPGPNDLLPCGTESAVRRHLAKRERCWICGVPKPAPGGWSA
jgi:hypothetical protein